MSEAPEGRRPEHVLATVTKLIREVIDDDAGLGAPITLDTSFNEDLELESIEFVALAEKLKDHYGSGVDFAGWLSGMELDRIIALRVGELVEFIVRCPS